MRNVLTLRVQIRFLVALMVFLSICCGGVMMGYTHKVEKLVESLVEESASAYQAAEALEAALVNQKGFMSYYIMDRNPEWLQRLGEYRQLFRMKLQRIKEGVETEEENLALQEIEAEYDAYVAAKDRALGLYVQGQVEAGRKAHLAVRQHFFRILSLCEAYRKGHEAALFTARKSVHVRARRLRWAMGFALVSVVLLGWGLLVLLGRQVLIPLRRLAREGTGERGVLGPNEVMAVTHRIENLVRSEGEAQSELARSRESLVLAEKMALVGKLAAGMAHSIRNPLTSVKMRLFSLNRSLKLDREQEEDFQVISREIGQVDTIVQNFLEFSRPPRLSMQKESPSTVVDRVLQLLSHRLRSYEVDVRVHRKVLLPEIICDPEQLKEVFVNLVENACNAMNGGGCLTILEECKPCDQGGGAIHIHFEDEGCGIAEDALDQVFQPFFFFLDEGTGLGLPICERIVENHGGWMKVTSTLGQGTRFTVSLPLRVQAIREKGENS